MQYDETHPWITFTADLTNLNYKVWLLLGEAESKCEHIANVPLRPDVAKRLHEVYLSKGVHGTTSIEGNTLTEEEVLARVRGELELPPSRAYLGQEVDNVLEACNLIVADVVAGRALDFTPERVKHFNELVLKNLDLGEGVVPGETRQHSVIVGQYRGAPAADCDYLLERLCKWLDTEIASGDDPALTFSISVFKAILAHLYIAWIHPFGDGNGRVARLIEFQLLVQAGVPTPAAHLLSNHYNHTRTAYYRELERTSKRSQDGKFQIDTFLSYAIQGFIDGVREQLATVRRETLQATWENYVHEQFRDREESKAKQRQKHLVLDMRDSTVATSKVREISPRLAVEYADKTTKTISRDLNALEDLGLIRREGNTVRAAIERMSAFLPVRAEPQ